MTQHPERLIFAQACCNNGSAFSERLGFMQLSLQHLPCCRSSLNAFTHCCAHALSLRTLEACSGCWTSIRSFF